MSTKPRNADRLLDFTCWLNSNAGQTVSVQAENELDAACAFACMDSPEHRFVWVQLGADNPVLVETWHDDDGTQSRYPDFQTTNKR